MQRLDIEEAVRRIASVLPEERPVELHKPFITEYDGTHYCVDECINKDPVGYNYIQSFEKVLRKQIGVSHAIAVSSGTAALHLALMAAGVKPGDEVLVPSLTFVATANAVVHAGAIPNFIDGKLNINPYKLRCYLTRTTASLGNIRVNKVTGRPVRALIAVHLLGVAADMTALQQVTDDFGLILIEDASEALGSKHGFSQKAACGSFGAAATLSFNCNKIVTTGGGGAVLTNDPKIAEQVLASATTARVAHDWNVEHDAVAWNYRMPNICAAMGLSQLEQLDNLVSKKQELFFKYLEKTGGLPGWYQIPFTTEENCWLNAGMVDCPEDRDPLLAALHAEGIKARAIFTPLHKLPMYKDSPRDSMVYTCDTAGRMVCLPSGSGLI